jgi:WhiB family transcriptional regulator, redox-sensing transcriptional regulator
MVVTRLPAQRAALEEERRDWWQLAACRETDPELFFPVTARGPGAGEIARAKAVCATCQVRRQCLQYALATHQVDGVWGGTTEDERRLHVRRERERQQQRERRDVARQRRAEPGGRGGRGRGARIRSV